MALVSFLSLIFMGLDPTLLLLAQESRFANWGDFPPPRAVVPQPLKTHSRGSGYLLDQRDAA